MAHFNYWIRERAADTISNFVRDTKFNFAVFTTVVNQFRKNVIASQRMARNFIYCRRAKYETLLHLWVDMEKQFISNYKMRRKVRKWQSEKAGE